jgi:hypothetical protein
MGEAYDRLLESEKYLELNKSRRKQKVYPAVVDEAINARIPPTILKAMQSVGWNALGIYEVVADELRREKKPKA